MTIEAIITEFKSIDDQILNWEQMSDHNIAELRQKLHKLKRQALRYKLSFQDDIFYEDKEHATDKNFQLVSDLLSNIETAEKFIDSSQIDRQNKSLKHLTYVSTVCLPLSIITGFFGMNFGFMGMEAGSKGILRWKHAQLLLWGLIFIVLLSVVLLFKIQLL